MTAFNVCISKTPCQDVPMAFVRESAVRGIATNSFYVSKEDALVFANFVGIKGHPFCPSTFKNEYPRKDTFEQTQLFPLFFDNHSSFNKKHNNDLSFSSIAQRAKQYHLPIFFAYDTFSEFSWEPDHQMFCVVFINEMPIFNIREAEAIQKALLTIFPEAVREHSSVIDLFFGGNKVLYYDKAMPTINPDLVFMTMCSYLKNRYGVTNFKRKITSFAEETGVALDDRNLPIVLLAEELQINTHHNDDKHIDENPDGIHHQKNNKNSPKPTIYREEGSGENLSRLSYIIKFSNDANREETHTPEPFKTSKVHQMYRSNIINIISVNCELYHEFESSDTNGQLSYRELLGLATNLAHVESGEKTFLAILKSKFINSDDELSLKSWNHCFHFVRRRNPYPCSSFCPYHKSCAHGQNILSTSRIRPHQIERINDNEEELVSLDEAHADFEKNFRMAVNSSEKGWHIIKSQTALGKTQAVLQLLRDHPEMKILLVVPTNKLKREVSERAKVMGIHLDVSPSLHELEDVLSVEVWDDIEEQLNLGRSPIPIIKKAIEKGKNNNAKLLKQYLSERDTFYSSDGNAITTHRRLSSVNLKKYDLVIIDEDYVFSTVLMDRISVSMSDLKNLKKKLPARDSLRAKIKEIQKECKIGDLFTSNEIDYVKSYAKINTDINIRELCAGTHFYYHSADDHGDSNIIITKRPNLSNDIKYIMLSATAKEDICCHCFGEENVKFYASKEARLTGTLYQYYERPMSRDYIDKHPKVMSQIKDWTGFSHTITFKKYANYCTDDMYFGNCLGCDVLKGQNIDVIGTPHQPDWVYKLFAFTLGFDVDDDLNPCSIVTNNGYRFRFATFDDKILRSIQFYIIETDLEQAIGRARLLRCDATVNLFSNFPLRQAILKESEYDT